MVGVTRRRSLVTRFCDLVTNRVLVVTLVTLVVVAPDPGQAWLFSLPG